MWKDYLYLNKKEKSAFWAFTLLIVIMQLAIWTSGKWLPLLTKEMMKDKIMEKDSVENQMIMASAEKYEKTGRGGGSVYSGEPSFESAKTIRLRQFDPNTADSATLVSLGIRPYVARNIIKYRSKGGKFRKPEDFSRIYGLEKSVFESLSPYIITGNEVKTGENVVNGFKQVNTNQISDTSTRKENVKSIVEQTETKVDNKTNTSDLAINSKDGTVNIATNFSFELNSADTSSLQLLKGVGPVTAAMITRYGNQLGGYHDISQLSEIKGIYPNVLASLQKSLTVNPSLIRKININKASLEKLKAHPYLDFYQAKAIVGLRNARKGIKDLKELADFKEFSPEDMEKLKWYLEI